MNSMKPFGMDCVEAKDDMYYAIHKGIRLSGARVLIRIGQTDAARDGQVAETLAAVRSHLAMSLGHLTHESSVIHAAIEGRCPGAATDADDDHERHEAAFGELERLVQSVEVAGPAARGAALRRLYLRFALFVADDLKHMHDEETQLMPLMMSEFSGAERAAMTARIRAALAPAEMARAMALMLAAASEGERKAMIEGLRAGLPGGLFDGLLRGLLGAPWTPGDYAVFDRLAA